MTDLDLRPLFDATEGVPPAALRDMALELGPVTHRYLLEHFAADADSPWALEMHRRLVVGIRAKRGWAEMVTVTAPPVGWEILGRWAKAKATEGVLGEPQSYRTERKRLARLGVKIDTELFRLTEHPAYQDKAVLGLEPMVLPAFRVLTRTPTGRDRWGPPRPTPAKALAASDWPESYEVVAGSMQPYATVVKGSVMTVWRWVSDGEAPPA